VSDSISQLPARPSLEHLRKQAKELLRDFRAGTPVAAERMRAIGPRPEKPADVTLADAQFVLAREYGFDSWPKLVHHVAGLQPSGPLEPFVQMAADVVAACASDDAAALGRVNELFGRSFTPDELRAQVRQRLLAMGSHASDFALADVQLLIARQYGFESWAKLAECVAQPPGDPRSAPHGLSFSPPFYRIDWQANTIQPRPPLSDQDWEGICAVMKDHRITGLNAGGQMTDAAMERLSRLDHVTRLIFDGTKRLTDDGLRHLVRMPQLLELDLSDHPGGRVTDRGLDALRHLTELRRFQICWQGGISDAGVANLAHCEHLESVNLLGTPTGDGALRALAGKATLSHLKTGRQVTDAGLPLLHQFPAFKRWQGGEARYGLMSFQAEPTHLLIDGPFTDAGLVRLAGLDGLFGLSFFGHTPALTPKGLGALTGLPNLGFLGCQGELCDDEAMRHIVAMPRLRMLMGQGAVAGDVGWSVLSRSRTIEYIWGRECPNLTGRGFAALAAMPALCGLAVSCKNVDDAALSLLPSFPALRALMPMDVSDEGFRHVGRCELLEELWCMYCRDTGDVATRHIAGLSRLKSYYAGFTQITDESLKVLGRMPSLERIEFHYCAGITDEGVAHLAGLPRLRELIIEGSPNVTRSGIAVAPAGVRVSYQV
jgi:hypothetical protein